MEYDDTEAHNEEEEETDVLLGSLSTNIVGCRYYQGVAHAGEFVIVLREPTNPYDGNALRVTNLRGAQVGHIGRVLAAQLAPLCDAGVVRLEASVTRNAENEFTLPVSVSLYGSPDAAARVRACGVGLLPNSGAAAPASRGHASTGPPSAVVATRAARAGASQAELDALFDAPDSALAPFDAAREAPALVTRLFPHQAAGVAWMLARERNPDNASSGGLPPFWSRVTEGGKQVFLNAITASSQAAPPAPVHGGLLCDDMGLGKTLQIISVLLANPADGVIYAPASAEAAAAADAAAEGGDKYDGMSLKALQSAAAGKGLSKTGTKAQLAAKLRSAASTRASGSPAGAASAPPSPRPTLVVCPLSVASAWEEQLAHHVASGVLKVHVYLGPSRVSDVSFLSSQDVVITSYATLAADAAAHGVEIGGGGGGKRKRAVGLHAVAWRRLVCDEAHVLRNRETKASAAALAVTAACRWLVTGTPIVNKADDAQPLLAMLRVSPLEDPSIWRRAIGRPAAEGDPVGLARLRAIMRSMCLRRTKALLGASLPPKTVLIRTVRLGEAQRSAYDALAVSARHAVAAALVSGGDDALLSSYATVLECILRMRQAADDPGLVPASRLAAARAALASVRALTDGGGSQPPKLSADEVAALFAALKGALGGSSGRDEETAAVDDTAAAAAAAADDCCVCLEQLAAADARLLRKCKHAFCASCLSRLMGGGGGAGVAGPSTMRCPLCRASFAPSDVLSRDALLAAARDAQPTPPDTQPGGAPPAAEVGGAPQELPAKVRALIESLDALRASDADAKAVVFSCFTSFLDTIRFALGHAGYRTARVDGRLSAAARKESLLQWNRPNSSGAPSALLVSTLAGGLGLTLTAASTVFLMDSWWNAATDEQAIDRVHRLGQTQPVTAVRFVAESTLEERILELQARKAALNRHALAKPTAEEARAARAADLRSLFDV